MSYSNSVAPSTSSRSSLFSIPVPLQRFAHVQVQACDCILHLPVDQHIQRSAPEIPVAIVREYLPVMRGGQVSIATYYSRTESDYTVLHPYLPVADAVLLNSHLFYHQAAHSCFIFTTTFIFHPQTIKHFSSTVLIKAPDLFRADAFE